MGDHPASEPSLVAAKRPVDSMVYRRDSDLVKRPRGRVTADGEAPGASPRRG